MGIEPAVRRPELAQYGFLVETEGYVFGPGVPWVLVEGLWETTTSLAEHGRKRSLTRSIAKLVASCMDLWEEVDFMADRSSTQGARKDLVQAWTTSAM